MGAETAIGWTQMTHNEWIGCEKVSPGCLFCYAEARDLRFHGGEHWGPGAPRRLTSETNRNNLLRWDRAAEATGRRWVFVSSLSDVFDKAVPAEWRVALFDRIRRCRGLRFQLVTKRIPNARRMLPADWEENFRHCGIIISVVDPAEAARDIIRLLRTPCAWRGISYEPALAGIDFRDIPCGTAKGRQVRLDALTGRRWTEDPSDTFEPLPALDWVIVGGESGPQARSFDPAWAESVVAQCAAAGVPAFVKQMGSNPVGLRLVHRKGEDSSEWPEGLRVRQMPIVYEAGGRLAA